MILHAREQVYALWLKGALVSSTDKEAMDASQSRADSDNPLQTESFVSLRGDDERRTGADILAAQVARTSEDARHCRSVGSLHATASDAETNRLVKVNLRYSRCAAVLPQKMRTWQHRQLRRPRRTLGRPRGWRVQTQIRRPQQLSQLLVLSLLSVAWQDLGAALPYTPSPSTAARRLLQSGQTPPPPLPSPSSASAGPPEPRSPSPPKAAPPQEPQQQPEPPQLRPLMPTSSPPPPPSSIGVASTSREFFRLLYAGPSISEIRLTKDVKLLAADAIAAAAAAAGGGRNPAAEPADGAAAAVLGVGRPGVQLKHNLTIVGDSRGTQTRLDANFLVALLRLGAGVRLTLRRIELYKALNQVGQVHDFLGKSTGGVLVLEDVVQRRAACLPMGLMLAQILSLPQALDPAFRDQNRHVSLRNESAFCWSTSSLLPTCKKPSLDVDSFAAHVSQRDGVLVDSGGYDVSYIDSHIVCDYPVDPACLQTSSAEQCIMRELARHFGDGAMPAPAPPSRGGGAAVGAQESAQVGEPKAGGAGGGGGGPSRALVVGLAAGLAGGVTLLLLSAAACGVVLLRRRRRRAAEGKGIGRAAAGADAAVGGSGAPYGGSPSGLSNEAVAAAVANLDDLCIGGTARQSEESTTAVAASGRKATAFGGGGSSNSSKEESSGTRVGASTASAKIPSAAASGGAAGRDLAARAEPGGGAAALAAAAVVAAASGRSRPDPLDVESIRRSLMRSAQRNPEAPLKVQVLSLLGEGSFGKVYKGIWQGTAVALKVLVLSGNLTQDQRRRQMAVMEAAISSSMSHPNIVQTYSYSFRPIRDAATPDGTVGASSGSNPRSGGGSSQAICPGAVAAAAGSDSSRVYGHELLLILEYCDRGSLRQALDAGVFHRHGGGGGGGGDGGGGYGPAAREEAASAASAAAGCPSGGGGDIADETDWLTPAAEFSTLTGPPTPTPHPPPTATTTTRARPGVAEAATTVDCVDPRGPSVASHQRRMVGQLSYNYALMLQVACDVASALLHLHSHGVVHGDVKASNVLLKTAAADDRRWTSLAEALKKEGATGGSGGRGSGNRAAAAPAAVPMSPPLSPPSATTAAASISLPSVGLIAKVADFGLSTVMGFEGDNERTHITALTAQGSLTHMAPELMLHGHISKRVDVYAFGVLLYELLTGERAHRGVPRALLPHQVAVCGLRPTLPPHSPPDLRRLVEACWATEPTQRPTFEYILGELERMRAAHAAGALAASRGASFSTSISPGSVSVQSYSPVRPDGWVQVPPLESSTCSSTLFEELVCTRQLAEEGEEGDGGGGWGGGGGGGAVGGDGVAAVAATGSMASTLTMGAPRNLALGDRGDGDGGGAVA